MCCVLGPFVITGHHVDGGSSPNNILLLFGPFLCALFHVVIDFLYKKTLLRGVAGISSAMVMEVVATIPKTYKF